MKKIVQFAAGCVASVLGTAANASSLYKLKPTALTQARRQMRTYHMNNKKTMKTAIPFMISVVR
jgi:hypothetical protein